MRIYQFAQAIHLRSLESSRCAKKSRKSAAQFGAVGQVQQAKSEFGAESVEYASALLRHGDAQVLARDALGALKSYRRASSIFQRLGAGHELLLAIALRSLSSAHALLGDQPKAESAFARANRLIQEYQ